MDYLKDKVPIIFNEENREKKHENRLSRIMEQVEENMDEGENQ